MEIITVFDFDKTLTKKDTLFGFFIYASKGNFLRWPLIVIYFSFMVLGKFGVISNDLLKSLGIKFFISGKSKKDIDDIGESYSKIIEYNFLYKQAKKTTGRVVLVTASFDVYTRHVLPDAQLFASKLAYKNDRVVGLDFNCYGSNKADALKSSGLQTINKLYTDSSADIPLAKMSSQICLVTSNAVEEFNNDQDFINRVCNGRTNV